jgi:ATP-dependent Clp protease adaptor protein ClpS
MTDTTTLPDTTTRPKEEEETTTRQMPPYNVILLDDDDHSYEYVIHLLQSIFGYPREKGYLMALEVDTQGRVVVLTTYKELAELKRDQIHAFGPDSRITRCKGSMSAVIEPAPG